MVLDIFLPSKKLELLVLAACSMWNIRNNFVYNDQVITSPLQVAHHLQFYLDEFQTAGKRVSVNSVTSLSAWNPSPLGAVKVNCDATWSPISNQAGIGIITRDHTGSVLSAKQLFIKPAASIFDMECKALLFACLGAQANMQHNVIFESDNLSLVWAVNFGPTRSNESVGKLKAIQLMFLQNPGWSCTHVFREGNEAADFLAKAAVQNSVSMSWNLSLPRALGSS